MPLPLVVCRLGTFPFALGFLPEFGCFRPPMGCILVAFGAQVLHALRGHGISGMGASLGYHLPQLIRILQHGARTEHIIVERLVPMIGHENRGLKALQQAHLPDIGIGVVDEYTGSTSPLALICR